MASKKSGNAMSASSSGPLKTGAKKGDGKNSGEGKEPKFDKDKALRGKRK
jgi:hypothetical protein